jgi:hypothetical protein
VVAETWRAVLPAVRGPPYGARCGRSNTHSHE